MFKVTKISWKTIVWKTRCDPLLVYSIGTLVQFTGICISFPEFGVYIQQQFKMGPIYYLCASAVCLLSISVLCVNGQMTQNEIAMSNVGYRLERDP